MHIARMHCAHCKDALCTGFCKGGGHGCGLVLFYCIHLDMVLYVMAVVYGIRQYSPLACLLD